LPTRFANLGDSNAIPASLEPLQLITVLVASLLLSPTVLLGRT
jgi:hypothetical protein